MKISKRFHLILLCMLALLTAGCGKQAEETMPRAVACTTYPIWLITHDLMQRTEDAPPLILLVPPQMGCPHDFALSTHDLLNLSMIRDLLFVANGGGLDDVILSAVQKAKPDLKTVLATGLKLDLKEHAGHKHDADHDEDADPVHDPHYFTAPGTAKILVKNIADALKKFDERNKSVYEKNESAILKK